MTTTGLSVLPNVSTVHEFFDNLDLMQYAREVDLIGEHQYAYARNLSTTVALIKAVDSWKVAIHRSENHTTLLNKMRDNGVTGNELKWFNSYLDERHQYVSSGGEESSKRLITHGVPRGSILGPTLFNIHVNDICKVCWNTEVFLYADDTELHVSSTKRTLGK